MRQFLEHIEKEAGKILLKYYANLKEKEIHLKATKDYVTEADKRSEEFIVKELKKEFPEAGIFAEEGDREEGRSKFLIDPLDGTNNFIHGIPYFCISIAYEKDGEIQCGAVYDPIRKQMFSGEKGNGAFLNGEMLEISKTKFPSYGVVSVGFPPPAHKYSKDFFLLLEELLLKVHMIRWMGAAALDLSYVAAGKMDATIQFSLNPWDVGAAWLLIEEAGGVITDFSGSEDILSGWVVAGNKHIQPEILEIVKRRIKRD